MSAVTDWQLWNDGTVPKLAQTIYDDKRLDLLPILADALEEAGHPEQERIRKLFCNGPSKIAAMREISLLIGGELADSVAWIDEYVKKFPGHDASEEGYWNNPDITYEMIMQLAVDGNFITEGGAEDWRSTWYNSEDQFWDHYEKVMGEVAEHRGETLFSCSC